MENSEKHGFCKKVAPPPKRVYERTPAMDAVLSEAKKLSQDEQFSLIFSLMTQANLTQAQRNTVKNFVTQKAKDEKASEQSRMADSRARTPPPLPSLLPATKVSLGVRADLITEKCELALDMEKIIDREHKNVAGDFAMVNGKGQLVVWCYIKRDDVCRFNTKLTGLDKEKIERGISPEMLRDILAKILRENVLVGADLLPDLKSIGYQSTGSLPVGTSMMDVQDFFRDRKGDKISLAQLVEHFTGENFQNGTHSSVQDARMTMMCYKKMLKMQSAGVSQFTCPEFDDFRDQKKMEKKKERKMYEKCTCAIRPDKKKKQNWRT